MKKNLISYRTKLLLLVFCVCSFMGSYCFSQSLVEQLQKLEAGESTTVSVDTETSSNNDFKVNAQMDRSDRTYMPGESFRLKINSEKSGHLYIACESGGKTNLIFPNDHAKANQISARREYTFPATGAPFAWRIQGKPGTKENLILVVAERPLNINGFDLNSLSNQEKELFATNPVEVVPNFKMGSTTLGYQIVDKRPQTPSTTPTPGPTRPSSNTKRIAMIFTQTHMINPDSRKLERDRNIEFRVDNAIHVGNVLKKLGGINGDVDILYGEDFNKRKIKEAFANLARKTNPGDEIFIYWESHGGTGIKDTTGREPDGKHEFLCMVDYATNEKDGYIQDDEFADMLGVFKDRRVMILMEACHSGGLLESSSRNINRSVLDTSDLLSDARLCSVCKGDIDYSDLVSKNSGILNFSDIRGNSESGSEMSFSSFATASEGTPSSGNLLQSLHSLTKSAKGDTPDEQVFVTNVASRLAQTISKDINSQTPNLSIIFSSSKHEVSYCASVDEKGEIITLPDSEGTQRRIGAPVLSLVMVMADTQGNLTTNRDRAYFDDVWNVAKELIPANVARIAASSAGARGATQMPVYMNTIKDVCVRPATR